ncbi:MAG: protein kinase [Anaerolineae bacterium]|nr:protein kinase [Anaerolineae bacterium]
MADPNDLVGQQIGQYQVRQHLARGGMADVYLALDTDLQRQVVLKVLLPNFAQDSGFVERFRREAQAMAQLHHPNVVQVYAIGTTGNRQPYIAMQFVPEGTLAEKLADLGRRKEILTTPYALALARQVADALAAAHRKGIVHRDLKPSNILLDAHGKPLLTDLGIAVVESNPRLTQTNVLLGTPHYMAPEQVKGEPVDGRTDLYSLGIILYELFAGMRPFTADVQWGVLHKQIYEEARPLHLIRPDLAPEVIAIIEKCMRKAPEDRYQSAEELVVALDQALHLVGAPGQQAVSGAWLWQPPETGKLVTGGSKIVPPPASTIVSEPVVETQAQPRRRWSYAWLLLLLLLPLFVFGGWQVWLRTQATPVDAVTSTPETAVAQTTPVEQLPVSNTVPTPTDTAVSSTPTATVAPTVTAVTGEIELVRPGVDTFTLEDEVQFTWRWPAALTADQLFTLYFEADGKEMRAMSVEKPFSGSLFRLQFVLGDILETPGVYRWFIRLEADGVAEPLLESDNRELVVEEVIPATATATATSAATATIRASATPAPTNTATRPAATATSRPPTAPPPTSPPPTAPPPTAPPPTSPPPTAPPPTAPPPTAPPPTAPPPTAPPPTAPPPTEPPPTPTPPPP